MIVRGTIVAALTAAVAVTLHAQHLADAQSRREAIRLYRIGEEFFSAEKFDRAAEEFTKATAKDPLFTLAYYQAGQSYMNLKRYASAIKAFRECLESTRTLYGLAETNRFAVEKQREDEIREMRESLVQLQSMAGKNPQSQYPVMAMRAEQHLRDLENQRTSLAAGYRAPAEVLLSLGSAYFRNGERDAAEAEWKAAVEVNPKLGEAHNNLAVIYMTTGRLDDATAAIKAAEKAGFRVNPQLKEDVKKAAERR